VAPEGSGYKPNDDQFGLDLRYQELRHDEVASVNTPAEDCQSAKSMLRTVAYERRKNSNGKGREWSSPGHSVNCSTGIWNSKDWFAN
jgi:hypothetical protein